MDPMILKKINDLSNQLEAHTIEVRRYIHEHPELSYAENNTSEYVCKELEKMGVPYEKSPQKPGIIATIDSGKPGRFLMLRADMDALPIEEKTGLPYASKNTGVMHACGHDVHTANLLTVGNILNQTKDFWNGKVKLVFQPAEENGGGGREMIKAGLMDELPDACMAMHVEDGIEGKIVVGKGYLTAYSDSYTIKIHGRSAHSSTPERGVDAIYIASFVVQALHGIISRNLNPLENSTLNIGVIQGGKAPNIICDEVTLVCMLRNLTKEAREVMCNKIESLSKCITESMGGTCECIFRAGYPAVYNNERVTEFVTHTIENNAKILCEGIDGCKGEELLITDSDAKLGAEDFGFYAQKVPSCFLWVGTGGQFPKHSSTFVVEEKYIKLYTRTMCLLAVEYLNTDI